MESLYKLKSMEAKFRKVVVAHDMAKLERDDCRALVSEAKLKTENDSGDWVYRAVCCQGNFERNALRHGQPVKCPALLA